MRPRLNYWCVIAYNDGPPEVWLCTRVRNSRTYSAGEFWRPCKGTGIGKGDHGQRFSFEHSQVIAVLQNIEVPPVPPNLITRLLKN